MLNLENFYEEIPLAHQYFAQGDFESAIDIYCKILDEVNPNEETVPYLYINYANCLIKNSNQYFIDEIQNLHSGFNLKNRKIFEEDLENAWEMLEVCKNSFTILKDKLSLGKTFFLLGEISLLNNEFKESILDYIECEEIYKNIQADSTEYIDLYLSMASAYEFLEDFDTASKFLREVVDIFKKSDYDYLEILDRIEELQTKKKMLNDKKDEEENIEDIFEDKSEVKDINANKKRIN